MRVDLRSASANEIGREKKQTGLRGKNSFMFNIY